MISCMPSSRWPAAKEVEGFFRGPLSHMHWWRFLIFYLFLKFYICVGGSMLLRAVFIFSNDSHILHFFSLLPICYLSCELSCCPSQHACCMLTCSPAIMGSYLSGTICPINSSFYKLPWLWCFSAMIENLRQKIGSMEWGITVKTWPCVCFSLWRIVEDLYTSD